MSNVIITPLDILEIYVGNAFINGKHVSDFDLRSFDFEEYIKTRGKVDFDSNQFFKDWHLQLAKNPWKYETTPIKEIQPGQPIIVFLYPATGIRDRLSRRSDPQFKNGYELPLLVLSETLTEENSKKLANALRIAERLKNLNFLKKRSLQFALLFITYIHLYHIEECSARINCSSNLTRGSLANCNLCKNKLDEIKSMSLEEKLAVTLNLNRPLFPLESILHTWESFGQRLAADEYDDSENESGLWLYSMLPPLFKTFEKIKSTFERIGEQIDEPKVRVPYETSKQARKILSVTKGANMPFDEVFYGLINFEGRSERKVDPKVYSFKNVGPIWIIEFRGNRTILKDLKGLHYLQFLLKYPGKEYHVSVLRDSIDGQKFDTVSNMLSELSEDQLEELGLRKTVLSDSYALVDKKTISSIENRCKELEALIETSRFDDPGQRLRYVEDLRRLKSYLKTTTGLGGKTRTFPTETEKLRLNITNRLTVVLRIIEKSNPKLWLHLKNAVRSGNYFSYQPEQPIYWDC